MTSLFLLTAKLHRSIGSCYPAIALKLKVTVCCPLIRNDKGSYLSLLSGRNLVIGGAAISSKATVTDVFTYL